MTTPALDPVDRRILALLQEEGSLSVSELAERIGMTAPPCWRRLRRLRDAKILLKQIWLVDASTMGFSVTIFASVKLAAHDSPATTAFRERVRELPEVLECYALLGSPDVLLKIVVSNMNYYEEFFYKRLSQLPGVREVSSSVVMSEVKKTTRLPI